MRRHPSEPTSPGQPKQNSELLLSAHVAASGCPNTASQVTLTARMHRPGSALPRNEASWRMQTQEAM